MLSMFLVLRLKDFLVFLSGDARAHAADKGVEARSGKREGRVFCWT